MLITKSPRLSFAEAARHAGVHGCTIAAWVDYDGLNAIRDDQGRRFIREAELDRFLAERARRQQARRDQQEERRREKEERRARWLAEIAERYGLRLV